MEPHPTLTKRSKVVIVDDSLTMRRWLSSVIDKDPRLTVVGTAATASEARAIIRKTNPDVLTLDLDMPQMDGMEFLKRIMRLRPMPVVMLSGKIEKNDDLSQLARRLGAAACLSKPELPSPNALSILCDQIVSAAVNWGTANATAKVGQGADDIILVGASTGGVAAIEVLLKQLSMNSPPTVIAQHMPHEFLLKFAKRLDTVLEQNVDIAKPGVKLGLGDVVIAPAARRQTKVAWRHGRWQIEDTERSEDDQHCPQIDTLFLSAVPWARRVGALLLTGIGTDGAKGMLALRQNGARTIGQSQDSCAVYGMPGAARAIGAVEQECTVDVAGQRLIAMMQQKAMSS